MRGNLKTMQHPPSYVYPIYVLYEDSIQNIITKPLAERQNKSQFEYIGLRHKMTERGRKNEEHTSSTFSSYFYFSISYPIPLNE